MFRDFVAADCAGDGNPLLRLAKNLTDGPAALAFNAPGAMAPALRPLAPAQFVDEMRLQRDLQGLRFGDTGEAPAFSAADHADAMMQAEFLRAQHSADRDAAAHERAFARAQRQVNREFVDQTDRHVPLPLPLPRSLPMMGGMRTMARPSRFARDEWRVDQDAAAHPAAAELQHPTAWAEAFLAADATATAAASNSAAKTGPSAEAVELARAAKSLLEQTTDPKLKSSKFMEFVQQLGDGELELEGNTLVRKTPEEVAAEWTRQFKAAEQQEQRATTAAAATAAGAPLNADEWARRYGAGNWGRYGLDEDGGWEDLAAALGGMTGADLHPDAWQGESAFAPTAEGQHAARAGAASHAPSTTTLDGYDFENDNPFAAGGDSFDACMQHGRDAQQQGALGHAIFWFEAAVQKDSARAEAWHALGECQMENEQDTFAIAALRQCVKLDPANCPAFLSLATCLTNEMEFGEAYAALEAVVARNPKYQAVAAATPPVATIDPMFGNNRFLVMEKAHQPVHDLYMNAVLSGSADSVDPELQIGLGILFNISREFDKAIDCFSAALAARPDDSRTWNKLGATLANSERSADAISAYRKALELQPGFIRARYNLGAGCINLQAYNEAAEHLLTALSMQQSHTESASQKNMSNSIWNLLRNALQLAGRLDLAAETFQRNLDVFRGHFDFP